jgi:hypothetical protein
MTVSSKQRGIVNPAYGGVEVNKLSPLYHPKEVVEERNRKPERRLFSVTTNVD